MDGTICKVTNVDGTTVFFVVVVVFFFPFCGTIRAPSCNHYA